MGVVTLLTMGDFPRMNHLSVKTLRHYHEAGLLEPAQVDPDNGSRLYDAGQVRTAQMIRRFRELGMPIKHVTLALDAPDLEARQVHEGSFAELDQTYATLGTFVADRGRAPVAADERGLRR